MIRHFFRPYALADDIAHNKFTRLHEFAYLLLYLLMQNIVYRYGVWVGSPIDSIWYSEAVLEMGILLIGLYCCWRANGGPSGRDFILRLICLAVPAGIIVNIVGFSGGYILRALSHSIYEIVPLNDYVTYYVTLFTFFVVLNVLFWVIIGSSMRRIVRQAS